MGLFDKMVEIKADVRSRLTVSIVSHGQGTLLRPLLSQLKEMATVVPLHVIITLNLPEPRPFIEETPDFQLTWIENVTPKGFGENHNAAFAYCTEAYFCVLNPDIRMEPNSLMPLLDCIQLHPGVAGPRVVSPQGGIEDSARYIPSPGRLLRRRLSRRHRKVDYSPAIPEQQVDWIAGMCMLFDRDSYQAVGGFDKKFRLYCEDTDICLRIHLLGRAVTWVQGAVVVHEARRTSHRNWIYFRWHVVSLVRLLMSGTYWRFRLRTAAIRLQHG